MYNFPPLPPVHDLVPEEDCPAFVPPPYTFGMMMAARHFEALVPPKKTRWRFGNYTEPPEPVEIILGWNDGSGCWRPCVYGFSPAPATLAAPILDDELPAPSVAVKIQRPSALVYPSAQMTFTRLRQKISLPSARRQAQKAPPPPPAPCQDLVALQAAHSPRRVAAPRQRLVALQAAARPQAPQSTTITSALPGSGHTPRSRLSQVVSPKSTKPDPTCYGSAASALPGMPYARTNFECDSQSYDNFMTYPIMKLPPKKVKRIEKRVVDGVKQQVEVEVEVNVEEVRKKLFLFADTIVCCG
ncbi:hypothetical protein BDN71DRAFT_1512838 [Pleurotus eryngii]|uniref:Uncharacterized protein n=1 Tax=Pleurotus eryngii TaxID=5323 RepID=A0A9P6DAH0_PLEER|nr:hypothetical protein BDN71DRAFT_1512838 [Pleurotus eryngii]